AARRPSHPAGQPAGETRRQPRRTAQHPGERPVARLLPLGRFRRVRRGDRGLSLNSAMKILPPVHPGEILLEEFLKPMKLSQYRLAKGLRVPPRRINELVHGKRGVSADTALRLARFFGTSARFWLNLQAAYDLDIESDRASRRIEREVEVYRSAG